MSPVRSTNHDSIQHIVDQLEKGTKIRAIEETDYKPTARSLARTPKEQQRAIQDHWVKGTMDYRYLDEIIFRMFLSEKEFYYYRFQRLMARWTCWVSRQLILFLWLVQGPL